MTTRVCKLPECEVVFEVTKKNPRKVYCSRSCSTINSNRVTQKRHKTKKCSGAGCDTLILSRSKYCGKACWPLSVSYRTIQDVKDVAKYQVNSRLRTEARNAYFSQGGTYACFVCGYDLHINVSHIKDLHQFPPTALVSDTCQMDNLVALCKNHHWEFDHGYLEVHGVLKELKPSKNRNSE